jgi:hypothetical protein
MAATFSSVSRAWIEALRVAAHLHRRTFQARLTSRYFRRLVESVWRRRRAALKLADIKIRHDYLNSPHATPSDGRHSGAMSFFAASKVSAQMLLAQAL